MLNNLSARNAAMAVAAIAAATIAGAWIFEYLGYAPCPLCLQQRWAYYAGIPLALVIAAMAPAKAGAARAGLVLLGLLWIGSAVFGAYHAGVEWKFWPGPDTCGGAMTGLLPDLSKPVVGCDEAAIRIFGLSLAGWNAVISLAMAAMALAGARDQGSSSVSQ
ncbi:MAG: disulfide bond formation protein B [Hyphomicrobiales bacterium]